MKTSVAVIASLLLFFFIINIIYEYTHTFNIKKSKYKNDSNQILLQFFLHVHIFNEIIIDCLYNFYVKLKIIGIAIYTFITFDKTEYIQNIDNWTKRKKKNFFDKEEIEKYEKNLYTKFLNKDYCEIKTVYFIRHSESMWNYTFNKKFNFKKILNISLIFSYELIFLFSSRSVLFDAPLSVNGIIQSLELSNLLKSNKSNDIQNGKVSGRESKNSSDALINELNVYKENFMTNYDVLKYFEIKKKNDEGSKEVDDSWLSLEEISTKGKKEIKNDEVFYNEVKELPGKVEYHKNKQSAHYDPEAIVNLSLNDHIDILNRLKHKSAILCSNLRRTISSCFISLYNRLNVYNENVYILNSLKEISRNPDCVPLLSFYHKYITTDMELFLHKDMDKLCKKNIYVNNATTPANTFSDTLKFIFENENDIFIIFGHSLWIYTFFNSFLKSYHKAKVYKLQNSGILLFNIARYLNDKNELEYEIISSSIRLIYKNFEYDNH